MPFTILLVDDDRTFRSEFRDFLEIDYEVMEAGSGEEALDIINKPHIVDLVMLDIRMPGLQGTEVLKKIKQIDPEVSIVMFSGYGEKDVIIESLRGHADDFLEKPLRIPEALNTIKRILTGKQKDVTGIINKIKYAIEKNFHKNISLKETSDIVCLSPKYISRIFKEHVGMGFSDYKLYLKVQKAKALLAETELNINQISDRIGYLNVESFVRIFKKLTGFTPSEYREQPGNREPAAAR
ncbi:MAG TPA: response regulator transcription factor [Spirochaetia bacterium]|nr:response regulator transcription factor [Spirochaetia bacterium]